MPTGTNEQLAKLFEFLKQLHSFAYDLGFKVQALELTLRTFPDTRPVYEDALKQVRSPEALRGIELAMKAYDAQVALARGGSLPSA